MKHSYEKECASLLWYAKKHGFEPIGVEYDGHLETNPAEFVEHMLATYSAYLYLEKDGREFLLLVIIGNSPGELVADGSSGDGTADLWAMVDEHVERWEQC